MEKSILISLLSGLSTVIGFFIIFLKKEDKNNIIGKSLSFASGIMVSVSFIDLIPESFNYILKYFNVFYSILIVFLFFLLGFILSIILDNKINYKDDELYKTGIISMIALILHNVPEGIVTCITYNNNKTLGITLAVAIGLHNIPEGISIAVPIYYSSKNKIKAFVYTTISGLSEFFGALFAFIFLRHINNELILCVLFDLIAGIMSGVVINELVPTAKDYIGKKKILFYFFIGFIVMFFSCFFI